MKSLVLVCFVLLLSTAASAQTLGSCQIFPSNNPWNVRVDSLPVDSVHSAAYIASVGGTIHVHPDFGSDTDYGIPWEAVNSGQPFVAINDSEGYSDQSDPGPMPIPPNARIEDDGDSHVLVVDTSNHHLYELYQGAPEAANGGWSATSTAIFALDSNNYRPDGWTSCDAAGLPIFPGLVRLDECKAGAINHALRFTVPHTQQAWIFPARHEASSITDTTYMPMGTRMRLKASFNDSAYTGYAKVIIAALKKYGIILADNGSAWYITGEWNPNWPDDDIGQLKSISGNDFEVVNTGYPIETESKEYPTPVIPIPGGSNGTSGILHIISNPINFGNVKLGQADTITVSMSNTGNGPLIITSIVPSGSSNYSILALQPLKLPPDTLQPGIAAIATIRFAPAVLGSDTASLRLTISGTAADTLQDTTIYFVGEGIQNASVSSDPTRALGLSVFPNPASGTVTLSESGAIGTSQIEITDQIGRSMLKETMQSGIEKLDLSSFPNGCYFIHAQTSLGAVSRLVEVVH